MTPEAKERERKRKREYYIANREKLLERMREYSKAHKEDESERQKLYKNFDRVRYCRMMIRRWEEKLKEAEGEQ